MIMINFVEMATQRFAKTTNTSMEQLHLDQNSKSKRRLKKNEAFSVNCSADKYWFKKFPKSHKL